MANALTSASAIDPPAPNPQPAAPQPTGNALAAPNAGSPMQVPTQTPAPTLPPAPSHAQTVTALRHFSAMEEELSEIMADPDLGKTDVRSKVIDGTTRLVADGIVSPAEAVSELGTFPDNPYDQRAWINQKFMQVVQGQTAILAHRQHGVIQAQQAGQPVDMTEPEPDSHQATMSSLVSQYKGAQRA